MQTIAITGATGLLGRTLVKTLEAHYHIVGCGFRRATPPLVSLDLSDKDAVSAFLDEYVPDVLIHAAAERKPDVCENDHAQTLALNVAASEHLAKQCNQRGIRLFFISTDYVFDGVNPPYVEQATTNPLNFYGQSKQQAELAVLASDPTHCVIRVPVLYGDVEYLAESAVTVIAEQLKSDPHSALDDWAIRYPTHVEDIALTLADLIALPKAQLGGIYHVSDTQALTKYQMAQLIASALGLDGSSLVALPEPTQSATRPHNCALKDTRLHTLGIAHHRDFAAAIGAVLNQHLQG
ncbi:NAD(P)-dependent oxidoreductase [Pseudoalteromonas rubra]|uniref:dTDP-4-dehydrorhamnose reductase n=1 Tax=Pseudoalteromonas rubra TaxID=43658 RepID=A0A5S3WLN2_9GAMM|nr:SDR family oxidoreductase [Pseudoalteromonas rubra]TMP28719.1 NAD(P)-dependent oxidoreductase [Pseudoalteromonas rubra]TMP28781.1 NAD(P)-dependent oxidoreductase [Pseudoalteromonas rubra]